MNASLSQNLLIKQSYCCSIQFNTKKLNNSMLCNVGTVSTCDLKIDLSADKSSEKSLLLQMGEVSLKGFFQKDYIVKGCILKLKL